MAQQWATDVLSCVTDETIQSQLHVKAEMSFTGDEQKGVEVIWLNGGYLQQREETLPQPKSWWKTRLSGVLNIFHVLVGFTVSRHLQNIQ